MALKARRCRSLFCKESIRSFPLTVGCSGCSSSNVLEGTVTPGSAAGAASSLFEVAFENQVFFFADVLRNCFRGSVEYARGWGVCLRQRSSETDFKGQWSFVPLTICQANIGMAESDFDFAQRLPKAMSHHTSIRVNLAHSRTDLEL